MELRIYSSSDGEQMNVADAQLHARGLDESNERVVDIIDSYFQTYRSAPVKADTIVKLIEATPGLKWLSAAELEYRKIAATNPAAAQELVTWLNTQTQLVSSGDQAYQNLNELLLELRGYEISSANINAAIDRIQAPRGKFVSREGRRPLHFVQAPRRTEAISPAAKADTSYSRGKPFSGSDMIRNPDGSLRSKNFYEQKADRDRAEAAKQPSATSAHAAAVLEAKREAESMRGNSHSEDAQLQAMFVTTPGTSDVNWPATRDARKTLQRSMNKHRETVRFIR